MPAILSVLIAAALIPVPVAADTEISTNRHTELVQSVVSESCDGERVSRRGGDIRFKFKNRNKKRSGTKLLQRRTSTIIVITGAPQRGRIRQALRQALPGGVALGLHGSGGTGPQFDASSNWSEHSTDNGLIPLVPTARGPNRNWDLEPTGTSLPRLVRKVRRTAKRECVSQDRVFVGGHSMGAHMASTLGCSTGVFLAVAPLAGVTAGRGKCKGGTSIIAHHSKDDWLVPFDGRILPGLRPILPPWTGVDRVAAVASWAKDNNCKIRRELEHQRHTDVRWRRCTDGVRVQIHVGKDWGHGMPVGWTESVFSFFAQAKS